MWEIDGSRLIIEEVAQAVRIVGTRERFVKVFGPRRYHGLIYRLYGTSAYAVEGEKPLVSSPGSVIYLPQGRPYTVTSDAQGDCIAINFTLVNGPKMQPFRCMPRHAAAYQALFQDIERAFSCPKPGHLSRCRAMLYELWAMLEEHQHQAYLPAAQAAAMGEAVAIVEARLSDPSLCVADLAARCHMSEPYFRKQFRRAYGVAPKRYVRGVRIRRAKDMLVTSALSISAISQTVGFDSIYHFSKAFREDTGMSPTMYRREFAAD